MKKQTISFDKSPWKGFALIGLVSTVLLVACGDDGSTSGSDDVVKINDKTISGVSQKGPFVNGSSVTVQELDGETLAQTGASYEGKIKNDKGEFSVKVAKLASQYALLKANGFYRNEVTGEKSKSQVTLYALTDLSNRDEVNVNLLTHLEHERSMYLASEGVSIGEAKKQAEKEVLASFGIEGDFANSEDLDIFGVGDGNAALLAVSVLTQGDLSEADFSERLANYAADIEEDGKWDDEKSAVKIADWAAGKSLNGGLAVIRNNIVGWELSTDVPDFEKYVNNFWWKKYGLESCTSEREGEVKAVENTKSAKNGVYFICKNKSWVVASDLEYDTYEKKCDEDGKIIFGNVNKERPYDCDGKKWREATDVEGVLGGCIEKRFDEVAEALESHYICESRQWREATDIEKDTYKWKPGKDADVKNGDVVKTNCYVFEDSVWRVGDKSDCTLNLRGCTVLRQDTVGLGENENWYKCDSQKWRGATKIEMDTATWGAGEFDGEIRIGQINKNKYYIYEISKNAWRIASTEEINTYQVECTKDGKFFNGKVDSTAKYVCDEGTFRLITDEDLRAELGCTSYTRGEFRVLRGQYSYYKCTEEGWSFTTEKLNEGTMVDERDGHEYKTIGIGSQMWMAENLNYVDSINYPSMLARNWCMDDADSCAKYGRYYSWSAAVDSAYWAEKGTICGYVDRKCDLPNRVKGICPEGWHFPNDTEWNDFLSWTTEKSNNESFGWENDRFGFSALPAGRIEDGNFSGVGEVAYFWSNISHDGTGMMGSLSMISRARDFSSSDKRNGLSVRCVKDEEE